MAMLKIYIKISLINFSCVAYLLVLKILSAMKPRPILSELQHLNDGRSAREMAKCVKVLVPIPKPTCRWEDRTDSQVLSSELHACCDVDTHNDNKIKGI